MSLAQLTSLRPRRSVVSVALALVVALGQLLALAPVAAASPPEPPVIASPLSENVSPEDVHMEIGAPFSDPDGDAHQATDWEIRVANSEDVVWAAYNSRELVHAHLSDGVFMGSLAGRNALLPRRAYLFRVRVQDSSGAWSAWSERLFRAANEVLARGRHAEAVLARPLPTWRTDADGPVSLPAGARLLVETGASETLLALEGRAEGLVVVPGASLSQAVEVRLRLVAPPEAGLRLPVTRLGLVTVEEGRATRATITLPPLLLPPGGQQVLWTTEPGATFYGQVEQSHLEHGRLATDISVPWQVPPGYAVEAVTAAAQLPTTIAFVDNPGADPTAPRYYFTELYGRIKVVTNDGRVFNFAEDLLNFDPGTYVPGRGEYGVIGICLPPGGRDVYATTVFRDQAGSLRNKLIRFRSADGLVATGIDDILVSRPGQGLARSSHQIQQCGFGPDGKLYTFMADGPNPAAAQDDATLNGKVLRLNPDGSAPADNPRFDPERPEAPISYQWTKGHRNAFGMAWRPSDGQLYLSENGPNVDRLVRVVPGHNYGWDGTDESMKTNALYVWPEAHWSPVGLTFVEGPAASALPPEMRGKLLVASAGAVYANGPQRTGKAIQLFSMDAAGNVIGEPTLFARYVGEGRGSIADLKLRPDGLYFTDLYLEDGEGGSTAAGGRVWRIHYTGQASFSASATSGPAPLTVNLADTSSLIGARDQRWDLGDGGVATGPSVSHTFATPGRYAVALTVTGADGRPHERVALITVTGPGGVAPFAAPAPAVVPTAASPAFLFFPESGMLLGGGFKYYWERHGGLAIFGYPISQEFRERNPADGQVYTVQYFERARFEYHPEKAGTPYETELGLLGRQASAGRFADPEFLPVPEEGTPEGARYFPQTGHRLAEPFRTRWETTGGADIYGLPISEAHREISATDGEVYLVQYFERVRMEYRPAGAGTWSEILYARLGNSIFIRRPGPRAVE